MKTLFKNGKIYTLDKNYPLVDNMLIEKGNIIFLGNNDEFKERYNEQGFKVIDLEKKTVLPGFNDAHLHLYQYALSNNNVDLSHVHSLKEIETRVNNYLEKKKIKEGFWIEGKRWNDEEFYKPHILNKEELDQISTKYPIILKRICFHVASVNSKALKLANINNFTPDPEGGKIGRDDNNNPNGILYDKAIELVEMKIPQKNIYEIKEILKEGFRDAVKVGLTSIQSDDFFNVENPSNILEAYSQLEKEKNIPLRITLQMRINNKKDIDYLLTKNLKTEYKNNKHFKPGPIKLVADGSLGARTAALLENYSDNIASNGILLYTREKLDELVLYAHKNGFQLAVHTIGDRALKQVLYSFEKMLEIYPKKDARPIIVHAQITNKELFKKMSKLGVNAAIQPIFLKSDWPIIEKRVGINRAKTSYAWKSLMKSGINLAGSSDAPVEPFNPLLGIYTAVCRKDLQGKPENSWHPSEKLTLNEALRIFTYGGAYQSFEEGIKGTLSIGKFADFVVLSHDIFSVNPDNIKNIKVEKTYVNGELVY
jgi:predicted amidohydrolase YtcJ